MKIFFAITLFVFFLSYEGIGQNKVYIITEKFDGANGTGAKPTYDSVFVTTPSGVTTKYQIPHLLTDISGHDSQFNIILNGVINQGYRIMEMGDWHHSVVNLSVSVFEIRTMFLGIP